MDPHASQKDYSIGFGGKYGLQTDRKDKSAVGWDEKVELSKHESQKGAVDLLHIFYLQFIHCSRVLPHILFPTSILPGFLPLGGGIDVLVWPTYTRRHSLKDLVLFRVLSCRLIYFILLAIELNVERVSNVVDKGCR